LRNNSLRIVPISENLLWVIDLYQLHRIELASKGTSCAELGFRNSPIPPEDDLVLQVQGVIIADERARSRSLAGAVVAAPVEDFVTAAHRGASFGYRSVSPLQGVTICRHCGNAYYGKTATIRANANNLRYFRCIAATAFSGI
jgi:hypothetical protein